MSEQYTIPFTDNRSDEDVYVDPMTGIATVRDVNQDAIAVSGLAYGLDQSGHKLADLIVTESLDGTPTSWLATYQRGEA